MPSIRPIRPFSIGPYFSAVAVTKEMPLNVAPVAAEFRNVKPRMIGSEHAPARATGSSVAATAGVTVGAFIRGWVLVVVMVGADRA